MKNKTIFYDTYNLYEIQILLSIKFHWNEDTLFCFCIIYDCFLATMAKFGSCYRKYLMSRLLREKFAHS